MILKSGADIVEDFRKRESLSPREWAALEHTIDLTIAWAAAPGSGGKWDFSSDEKLLAAHQISGDFGSYELGWDAGHKYGFKAGAASKNDWSPSIAGAIIMSVLLICATAIAIKRPEYFIDVHPIAIHLGDPIVPYPGSF